MSNLDTRVDKLERSGGVGQDHITSIAIHFVSPGLDGPVNEGIGLIYILGGGEQFARVDYETEAHLIAAANAEHIRVHGKPMEIPK